MRHTRCTYAPQVHRRAKRAAEGLDLPLGAASLVLLAAKELALGSQVLGECGALGLRQGVGCLALVKELRVQDSADFTPVAAKIGSMP